MSHPSFDQNVLEALFAGYQLQFQDGLQKATNDYETLAMLVQSNTAIERYPILEQLSTLREWIGPRQIKELKMNTLEVKNRTFENAVRVPRDAIADEQCSIYGSLIAALGMSAQNVWDDLVFEAMVGDATWLDKKPFFSADRTYGTSTINNVLSTALSHESYLTARQTMMSYVGEGHTPLNIIPNVLVCGPALEATARTILEGQFRSITVNNDSALADNPCRGTARLVVSTRLVGEQANTWFLMDTHGVIKPIILQQREKPTLTRIDSPHAEFVFKHNENLYGTSARGAATLSVPHLILRSTVSE